jgi:hypothetical protein
MDSRDWGMTKDPLPAALANHPLTLVVASGNIAKVGLESNAPQPVFQLPRAATSNEDNFARTVVSNRFLSLAAQVQTSW